VPPDLSGTRYIPPLSSILESEQGRAGHASYPSRLLNPARCCYAGSSPPLRRLVLKAIEQLWFLATTSHVPFRPGVIHLNLAHCPIGSVCAHRIGCALTEVAWVPASGNFPKSNQSGILKPKISGRSPDNHLSIVCNSRCPEYHLRAKCLCQPSHLSLSA